MRAHRSIIKKLAIVLAVLVLLMGAVYGAYRYYYPFGAEHRCDLVLYFALRDYAEKHGGQFPSGQATPEASLSLVHSLDESGSEYARYLRRRDVPKEVVREILKRGQLLDAETCGWNYVEGLRLDSDSGLALFWDKEGLGHNGERLSGGGHVVCFVNGNREHIRAAQWDDFIVEQQRLLAEEKHKQLRKQPAQNNEQPQNSAGRN